jgi:hypothetical protein
MMRWRSIHVASVLVVILAGEQGPESEAKAQTAQAARTEQLRVYARGGPGVYETNRHASGQWDAIDRPAFGLFGSIVQASGVGSDGYVFVYDGRAGGTLLRERPGDIVRGVRLPGVPLALEAPPFLGGGDPVDLGGTFAVCGTTARRKLLFTTQSSDGTFTAWENVEDRAGALEARSTLSCTGAGGLLHGCTVDAAGEVRHTIRLADGSWQPWDDVEEMAGDIGAATQVRCRGHGRRLFVLARSAGGSFFTERRPDGSWCPWQHLGETLGDPRADELDDLAVVNGEVHATGGGGAGVWHTIRHPDRSWDPIEDLRAVVPGYPAEARVIRIAAVAE